MSQYLIDTDWIIQVLHGDSDATTTLEDLAVHGLAISLVTYGEIYEGSYYAKDPQLALAGLSDFLIRGFQFIPGLSLYQRLSSASSD